MVTSIKVIPIISDCHRLELHVLCRTARWESNAVQLVCELVLKSCFFGLCASRFTDDSCIVVKTVSK